MAATLMDVMEAPTKSIAVGESSDVLSNGNHAATIEMIVAELQHLPTEQLNDVLQYVQFLEYKVERSDASEEESLWDAVLAHQEYKAAHPEEQPMVFETAQDFLKASGNW